MARRSSCALALAGGLAPLARGFAPLGVPSSRGPPVLRGEESTWSWEDAKTPQDSKEEVFQSTTYYADELCDAEEECELPSSDQFCVAVLGDLHIDPRKMEDYGVGRSHVTPILADAKERGVNTALVSLGDLGESKSVRPEETAELFAGTTACHEIAAEFLSSFGTDYEVIGGNHDLEGIDEFDTDEENLKVFMELHGKETPQFSRQIAEKTLLVGLGSTVFREARYTSHEVTVGAGQG